MCIVLPYTTALDDPKLSLEILPFDRPNQCLKDFIQILGGGLAWKTQHHNSAIFQGHKNERVGKSHVKSHQTAIFLSAHLDQITVGRGAQLLRGHSSYIVPGLFL